MKAKKYTYGIFSLINYGSFVFLFYFIGQLLYVYIVGIIAAVQGFSSGSILEWGIVFLVLHFAIFCILAWIGHIFNIQSKYILTDRGIEVLMFNYWFFWKFIPWEAVESFELSPRVKRSWILRVDANLTIWHRWISRRYCYWDDSVIVILESLWDWRGFKKKVKKYLAEKDELAE